MQFPLCFVPPRAPHFAFPSFPPSKPEANQPHSNNPESIPTHWTDPHETHGGRGHKQNLSPITGPKRKKRVHSSFFLLIDPLIVCLIDSSGSLPYHTKQAAAQPIVESRNPDAHRHHHRLQLCPHHGAEGAPPLLLNCCLVREEDRLTLFTHHPSVNTESTTHGTIARPGSLFFPALPFICISLSVYVLSLRHGPSVC